MTVATGATCTVIVIIAGAAARASMGQLCRRRLNLVYVFFEGVCDLGGVLLALVSACMAARLSCSADLIACCMRRSVS